MLDPETRHLLLDALRPPLGYELDRAVGTTYSLDLTALLLAPLAFAFFDWEIAEGEAEPNPLALLESVRTYSEKLTLFCQAGQIAWPAEYRHLLSYLEGSVCEVMAPMPGRVFHPKVWALRFTSRTDDEPRFRLLCLSRNLTFDRSWDTILRLDGSLNDTADQGSRLATFVAALPSLAVQPLPRARTETIESFSEELRRVRFDPPPGFDELAFWPLGLDDSWPFGGRIDRLFVASPFLSGDLLRGLAPQARDRILLSRPESLDALGGSTLSGFAQLLVLDDGADGPDAGEASPALPDERVAERPDRVLRGLHAKVYVADAGWKARVWTGSANATHAAFNGNVEFLVELLGYKSQCGVDAAVGDDAQLRRLLRTHIPPEAPIESTAEEELERRLQRVQQTLAGHGLTAQVTPLEDGDFALELSGEQEIDWEGVTGLVRPITLPPRWARALAPNEPLRARFEPISFEALTPFFAFELTATEKDVQASSRFVVTSRLVGAPADRRARLFAMQLRNAGDVIRYLLFLLGDGKTEANEVLEDIASSEGLTDGTEFHGLGLPLLESLLRTLAREPERLEWVARVLDDLAETEEGRALIPEGLEDVWRPIEEARKRMR